MTMKKILLSLIVLVTTAAGALAADVTTVWNTIKADKSMIFAEESVQRAKANGFDELYVAINSAPDANAINAVKRLTATIDANQKMTEVSQQGVDVSIYTAPADASGNVSKVMIVVTKNDNADKALIVVYGLCEKAKLQDMLSKLSLEDIIGG